MKTAKQDTDDIEALEGLDTLANLAILREDDASPSSQTTTKHPRHKPGCSCIVCIQAPSGKGPKHKQSCLCTVCQTVKRRFKTLMMNREKKQSDKEAETARKKLQQPLSERLLDDDSFPSSSTNISSSPNKSTSVSSSPEKKRAGSEASDDDPNKMKPSTSPFKGQIDLNIQPEREEEGSPGSESVSMIRLLQDANERYLKQRKVLTSECDSASHQDGAVVDDKTANGILFVNSHQDDERGDAFQ